jgi:hypothetical protein
MTRQIIKIDALQARMKAELELTENRPGDIARFREIVGTTQQRVETGNTRASDSALPTLPQERAPQAANLQLAHQIDFDNSAQNSSAKPERNPLQDHITTDAAAATAASTAAAAVANTPAATANGQRAVRESGVARPRPQGRVRSHEDRQQAMRPLVDLLEAAHRRAPSQGVSDLTLVPPSPNPMRLTLSVSMQGDDFVVKATTGLGAEYREHVQQSLQALEHALSQRLRDPVRARVILLA